MLKFLKKPYSFNDDLTHNAQLIFFISIGVFAFLLIFQPIEISSLSTRGLIYFLSGFAASTFFILTLFLIVFPSIFKRLFVNWNIKREIIWNGLIVVSISCCDLLIYSNIFDITELQYTDIGKTLLLGILTVSVLIIINQNRILRSNLKSAQLLNNKLIENKQQVEKLIHFESEYKNDELVLMPSSLIMIKSADNYIEVFYLINGAVKTQMIRSSLTKAEEKLIDYDYILKCHRSFIVNVKQIKEIKGDSQGYMLFFDKIDVQALVSQRFMNEFKKLI